MSACQYKASDVDLLDYLDGIIDLDDQILEIAFDFEVPKQEPYGTQIASAMVNENGLRAALGVRTGLGGFEAVGGNPLLNRNDSILTTILVC